MALIVSLLKPLIQLFLVDEVVSRLSKKATHNMQRCLLALAENCSPYMLDVVFIEYCRKGGLTTLRRVPWHSTEYLIIASPPTAQSITSPDTNASPLAPLSNNTPRPTGQRTSSYGLLKRLAVAIIALWHYTQKASLPRW